MSSHYGTDTKLEKFPERAPLFPLPSAVLFPQVMQPLHIFEPRYRKMIKDALEGDGHIALALLKEGWELVDEHGVPEIHDVACLAKIVAHEETADGRYHLVVQGVARVQVLYEEQGNRPYRVGHLRALSDRVPQQPVIDRTRRKYELLGEFCKLFPRVDMKVVLHQAAEADIPLGTLCDILCSALQFEPPVAQHLLNELNIDARSDLLLMQLKELTAADSIGDVVPFPPPFSMN